MACRLHVVDLENEVGTLRASSEDVAAERAFLVGMGHYIACLLSKVNPTSWEAGTTHGHPIHMHNCFSRVTIVPVGDYYMTHCSGNGALPRAAHHVDGLACTWSKFVRCGHGRALRRPPQQPLGGCPSARQIQRGASHAGFRAVRIRKASIDPSSHWPPSAHPPSPHVPLRLPPLQESQPQTEAARRQLQQLRHQLPSHSVAVLLAQHDQLEEAAEKLQASCSEARSRADASGDAGVVAAELMAALEQSRREARESSARMAALEASLEDCSRERSSYQSRWGRRCGRIVSDWGCMQRLTPA
jgi:hypothetical protein